MLAAFSTILVALDDRQGGLDAIALAALLASPGADVAIAHVVTSDRALAGDDDVGPDLATIAEARAILGRRSGAPGGDAPLLTARSRSVAAGLQQLVEARGADLLVIGAHHRRHLSLGTGDHARATLRTLRCALAVAPREYATRSPRISVIGVGYVDDRDGRIVLDQARTLAWQLDGEVHATMVVPQSNWESQEGGSGVGWRAAVAARRMAEIPGVHGAAREGIPRRALAQFSREVDLLVLGARQHGLLQHLLLGDVVEALLHTSACPLLLVPHPPPDRDR